MKLLEKLVMSVSPSGRENSTRDIIQSELKSVCDDIYTDTLGNLICIRKAMAKSSCSLHTWMK